MVKESAILFLKVFIATWVLVSLFNLQGFSYEFSFFYKITLVACGTATLWVGSGLISNAYATRISWLKAPTKRFALGLSATLIFTFLIWLLMASAWHAPQLGFDVWRSLRQFELSDFLPTLFITLFISIFMHGRSFLYDWRQSALEAEQLKKQQAEARFEALKNQVNPHFLFNSLNVLTALVHKDADMAEQFIRQLSAVYRYVLDSRDREVVPLSEEIAQLNAFIYLMKIRFSDSFNAVISVEEAKGYVAPLTLQMLVENAIKHNEASKAHPLHIRIDQMDDYIVVSNNRQPKMGDTPVSGVGLQNIRDRYHFLSDKPVIIAPAATEFIVKVPILHLQNT